MANAVEPKIPYKQAEWLAMPKNPAGLPGYKKYSYKDDETLDSIAKTVSKPWKTITGQWLALYNWGTSIRQEINWYLHNHNGCASEDSDGNYLLKAADTKPFVWVPKLERRVAERFRAPSKQDIGHVALDDESKKHLNTIVIPPVYSITLELGDIDALFEPIDPPGASKPIWERKGVQQRLQVLGYLYAPLAHSKINAISKAVWSHYTQVHTKGSVPPSPEEIKATLKQEVQNNLLCKIGGGVPTANAAIHDGRLPLDGEWAMIRLPGGYCFNEPSKPGPLDDPNFKYKLNADRHKLEDDVLEHNELMHKIPLVATVHRIKPDGKREPAAGVSVYFQLVKPDAWPEDAAAKAQQQAADDRASKAATALASNTDPTKTAALTTEKEEADKAALAAKNAPPPDPAHPLRAPNLRNTEMDFGKNSAPGQDPGPYVVEDAGPKRFVDDVIKGNVAADTEDPQADNAPFKFGGKRDHPVAGDKIGGKLVPGVFEVDTKRDGLHTKRDDKHADYGELFAAKKVEPQTETISGKQVKQHAHAVRAVTNDQGNAGVIFMPSRCGGDRYKLRAYVGPTTLGFAGDEPGGPVITTGTLVVWRNIRLYKYIQFPTATKATVHADVKKICDYDKNGDTFDDYWDNEGFASGTPTVDLSDAGNAEASYKKTKYFTSDGVTLSDNYRPIDVQFIGLVEQYRRCWCELIVEQPARGPHVLTDDELRAAVAAGRKAAADSGVVGKTIDWDVLVLDHPSPYMFTMRHWKHYNDIINDPTYAKAPKPPALVKADKAKIETAMDEYASEGIMAHLSGGGVLPGLTLIQSIAGAIWDDLLGTSICTSGVAGGRRACFVHYSDKSYRASSFCYSATANAAHELGHVLVRQHQDPNPGGDADNHEPQPANGATPAAGASGACVMGYMGCFGEYCGRCVLALRGWKIKSGKTPAGA